MGFNKPTFILDIIDGALFTDPFACRPRFLVRLEVSKFCWHPGLLMRQNSKGLSHTHARTQTHSRGRGTKAQPKKIHSRRTMQKLLDVLPPAPLVLPCSLCIPPAPAASSCLHLLPFSILLPLPTFLMLSDDYSKCKSQACMCV